MWLLQTCLFITLDITGSYHVIALWRAVSIVVLSSLIVRLKDEFGTSSMTLSSILWLKNSSFKLCSLSAVFETSEDASNFWAHNFHTGSPHVEEYLNLVEEVLFMVLRWGQEFEQSYGHHLRATKNTKRKKPWELKNTNSPLNGKGSVDVSICSNYRNSRIIKEPQ